MLILLGPNSYIFIFVIYFQIIILTIKLFILKSQIFISDNGE